MNRVNPLLKAGLLAGGIVLLVVTYTFFVRDAIAEREQVNALLLQELENADKVGVLAMKVAELQAANSVGSGATIGTSGTQSVSAADLVLTADGLPPNELGLFFYGSGQVQLAMGNGFRCVNRISRLPVLSIDGAGLAQHSVDYDDPPGPALRILPGSSWNFQFWYRDPSGGGAGFNQTNGIEVPFCD